MASVRSLINGLQLLHGAWQVSLGSLNSQALRKEIPNLSTVGFRESRSLNVKAEGTQLVQTSDS